MKSGPSILGPQDSAYSISQVQYVISLFCKGTRLDRRKGLTGFLVVEGINEREEYFMTVIGRGFHRDSSCEAYSIPINITSIADIKTTNIADKKQEVYKLLGCPIKTNIPFKGQSVEEGSWTIAAFKFDPKFTSDFSSIGKITAPQSPAGKKLQEQDYSFNKAIATLRKLGKNNFKNIKPIETIELNKTNFNPFAFLKETSAFPTARFLRPGLLKRFKDVFKVFYGNYKGLYIDKKTWKRNDLGLLDYIFPFSRNLWNFAIYLSEKSLIKAKNPANEIQNTSFKSKLVSFLFSTAAVSVALSSILLMGLKFLTAGLLTATASFIVVPIHLVVMPFAKNHRDKINLLKVRKIKTQDELDCIDDLNEQEDLEAEKSLDQTFSTSEMKKMLIKPIFKDERSEYSLNSIKKEDVKYFCLYEKSYASNEKLKEGTPRGIIEVKPDNYSGIYSAMAINMFKIDNTLENAKASMPVEVYPTTLRAK